MSRPTEAMAPYHGPERRRAPRIPAAAVPYLTAHLAGGPPVRLVDLAKRGVQIETTVPFEPGRTVSIRFVTGDASMTMTGAVVRSTVEVRERNGRVTYHTALAFTDELTLCGDELAAAEAAVPSAPPVPPVERAGDDYTMIVMDGRTGERSGGEGVPAC